jgi:hypothetical protein
MLGIIQRVLHNDICLAQHANLALLGTPASQSVEQTSTHFKITVISDHERFTLPPAFAGKAWRLKLRQMQVHHLRPAYPLTYGCTQSAHKHALGGTHAHRKAHHLHPLQVFFER